MTGSCSRPGRCWWRRGPTTPFLVALAALLQWLPPLLFGLWAGALTDRLDRRRLVDRRRPRCGPWSCVLLATAVATDVATIRLVLVALFLLGTAETFADNASSTMLPMLVQRDDLALANSRLMAGFVTRQPARRPADRGVPVRRRAGAGRSRPRRCSSALGAVLISRVALPPRPRRRHAATMRHDIAEGVRWVRHHAAVRTLVLTILIFNVTFGAAWSVLVLYATRAAGDGADRVRAHHDGRRARRAARDRRVRLDHPAGQPRRT